MSALAPFVPFKTSHDEKMPKVNSDHLASSGYMVMSSADAFDIKRQSGEAQVWIYPSKGNLLRQSVCFIVYACEYKSSLIMICFTNRLREFAC